MSNSHEKSPFIKIAYVTISNLSKRSFLDYDFFLILEGSIRVSVNKDTFFLGKNDVFLFEPGFEYQVSSAGNNVVLSIIVDSHFFLQGPAPESGYYRCNSANDSARNYTPLRQLLTQIAYIYFGGTDIANLHLTSYAYRLLYYINAYHFETLSQQIVPASNSKYQERITNILNYIHQNYASPITLQEAADTLHLTAPYLSAFFKQNMNENFNTYVNRVRLKHAVDELIYTDKSITAITYDNGFASMNAFNKLFKKTYETTPLRYRQGKQSERVFIDHDADDAVQELPQSEYQLLLEDYNQASGEIFHEIKFPTQESIYVENMHASHPITPIWNLLLNVGPISQLSKRDMEKQLAQIQESVTFQYARIEQVMNYHLLISPNDTERTYSFTSFDRVIDSLQMHQLIPYLDLSVPMDFLNSTACGEIQLDLDLYLDLLEALTKRNSNMYGPDFMENWYFEISPLRSPDKRQCEPVESFLTRFEAAYRLLKKYLPHGKIGGICHPAILDWSYLCEILDGLKALGITPDFLSLGILPFESLPTPPDSPSGPGICYTRDVSYAQHKTLQWKQVLGNYYPTLPPLHIAYLAPDCFTGHYLNDSCYQSAFFFHNTVDLLEEVDLLGYYQLSDIGFKTEESTYFLDGRNGLFNKYGIRKPGAQLLSIFSKCRNNLVQKGTDYVILKGAMDRYMIGMCNYTYVSEYDSFSPNKKIPIEDAYKIFENPQTKNIELNLNQLAVGDYDVILYQLNKKHGSVLDEWARNGYWDHFSREELEYMRKILQPLRTHYTRTSLDGTLKFQFQLAPHEVMFVVLLQRL